MNEMRFVDHISLGFLDTGIWRTSTYRDYMSLYKRFPMPPGIEFIVPRNAPFTIKNPWGVTKSYFELPEYREIGFADAADSFGQMIAQELNNGKHVYLYWSGGIDSTCVAVSVLKFIQPHHRSQISIVMSDASVVENPQFYKKYLAEFKREEFSQFGFKDIDIKNTLVLDGEGGDQIFGSSLSNKVFSMYPDKIDAPWRSEIDFITKILKCAADTPRTWDLFYNMLIGSVTDEYPIESLQDFFWWLNYNFKLDAVLTRTLLYYGSSVSDADFPYFVEHSSKRLFAHKEMQQWATSCSSADKARGSKHIKLPAKQYIYEFDKNEYFYREKRKEGSTPMFNRKYFALGKDFTRYSLDDRSVRKQIREIFYPEVSGKIYFLPAIDGPKFNDNKCWVAMPKIKARYSR